MPVVNGAGLVGKVVLVTQRPLHGPADHRPRLRGRRPPARHPGHRHRAWPGAGRGPPRRHEPRARRRRPAQARRVRHHERHRHRVVPGVHPGREGAVPRGLQRRPVHRPRGPADGRHRAAGLPHRAAVGATGVIPPSPLLVAIRTSLILVIALTIQLGMAPGLELFGVQADLLLLVAICGGDRRRPRSRRGHRLRGRPHLRPLPPDPVRPVRPDLRDRRLPRRRPAGLRAPRRLVDPGADRDRGEHGRCHPVRRVRDGAGRGARSGSSWCGSP